MARIHPVSTLALMFILLTQMFSVEGRDIKPPTMKIAAQKTSTHFAQTVTHDNNFPSLKPTRKIPKRSREVDSIHVSKVESTGLDKKGSDSPNENFPSKSSTSSQFFSASAMAHENDYRPTTPGSSPGAGHAHPNQNEKEESRHCMNAKCTQDFRPTAPGDSPGAGHSFVSNDSKTSNQGKHIDVEHTQAGQTDDFRPTAPGHSPGAGHPVSQESKKA